MTRRSFSDRTDKAFWPRIARITRMGRRYCEFYKFVNSCGPSAQSAADHRTKQMQDQDLTPMMRQYHAVKQETPDALLLFRLGDFYELFFEDAVTASRELQITLTARNKERGNPIPMCGVPYHAADGYIARLLRKGYKVAICNQMEAPQKGVKLVKREVTRVITPGTVTDTNVLTPGENNFLLALTDRDEQLGCAFLDI